MGSAEAEPLIERGTDCIQYHFLLGQNACHLPASSASVVSTLCDPMDYTLPGIQAKILEWVAVLFSRGSSPPRDRTWVSGIAGRLFTI